MRRFFQFIVVILCLSALSSCKVLYPNIMFRTKEYQFFELAEKAGGGAVGGYDRLWLNQGKNYMVVDGQIRTSIVIDPADGHLPPYNAAAKARRAGGRGLPTSDAGENPQPTAFNTSEWK